MQSLCQASYHFTLIRHDLFFFLISSGNHDPSQMTLGINHDTPLGQKQSLCAVGTFNVSQ